MAEEFGEGIDGLCGGGREKMEGAGLIEESAVSEDVKVRVENDVVSDK